jgi:hypothetical protein
VQFQSAGTWYDYLNKSAYTASGTAQTMTLQPGEFHVYTNRNVNGTSPTATAPLPWNETDLAVRTFPNPVHATLTVEVNLPQNSNVQLQLLDGSGRQLATLQNGHKLKGRHRFTFPRTVLPPAAGIYYLQVVTKTGIKTTPILVP